MESRKVVIHTWILSPKTSHNGPIACLMSIANAAGIREKQSSRRGES
jgi:hypothetical protein